jgi:hypothetical protein
MLMSLAADLFGGHDRVRDELNALPDEYKDWLADKPMLPHIRERLIALLVARQASRINELRRRFNDLKRDYR